MGTQMRLRQFALIGSLVAVMFGVTPITASFAKAPSNSIIDNPGRPTLIFVFQPFCNYCKMAAPFVAQLHSELGAEMDFVMITNRVQYTTESEKFRQQFGLTMPLIEDANLDFAKYKISGYPNFLWSVPGKGVTNWGAVGYDADDWEIRDVPKELRIAKYGPVPGVVPNVDVSYGQRAGVVDVSWDKVDAIMPVTHYEVRVKDEKLVMQYVVRVNGLSTRLKIPNVEYSKEYWVSVRALNVIGTGETNNLYWVVSWTPPEVRCQKGKRERTFAATTCPRGWIWTPNRRTIP
jgi:thiol-disulfide isomerase/thioredoxin